MESISQTEGDLMGGQWDGSHQTTQRSKAYPGEIMETTDEKEEIVHESQDDDSSSDSSSESSGDEHTAVTSRTGSRYFHTPPYNADDAQDTIFNLQSQVELLVREQKESQTEIEEAQSMIEKLQAEKLLLGHVNGRRYLSGSGLQENIPELEFQLKAAKSEILIRSCELETFKNQLSTLRKLNLDLQSQLTTAHGTIKELTVQKNAQRAPVDDKRCEALMQEIRKLQFQLSSKVESKYKGLEGFAVTIETAHREEVKDIEKKAEDGKRKLVDEIRCLESSGRILSEKMKKYKKDATTLREDNRYLEKKYEDLKAETTELTRYLGTGNGVNVFKRCKNLLSGYEGRIEQLEQMKDEVLRRQEELHMRNKILENKLSDEKRGRMQLMQRVRKQQDDVVQLEGENLRLKRGLSPGEVQKKG